MSSLPRPTSSEWDSPRNRRPASHPVKPATSEESGASALLDVLREALAEGTHSPDEVFRATADLARILTGADATAIALRSNGAVICRARSGDIAPELGSALNVNSGISGECFRTARVLRCDDTETDNRVEPEVCRLLGIRSIAVAPLCGSKQICGILEVFSGQPNAFGEEQIGFLMSLAEIAEEAYRLEAEAKPSVAPVLAFSPAVIPAFPAECEERVLSVAVDAGASKGQRRFWIFGAIAVLVLLFCAALVWRSWHPKAAQSISNPAPAETYIEANETARISPFLPPVTKPSPKVAKEPSDTSSAKTVVRNAAAIEAVKESVPVRVLKSAAPGNGLGPLKASVPNSTSSSTIVAPPTVVAAVPANGSELNGVASVPARLPTLNVEVSKGVTGGELLRKISPVYPPEALSRRIEGSVTVSASIADDGAVRDVKVLQGEALLATSAVAAIRQWRYSPTLLNGKPTPLQREITILFKLP